MPLVFRRMSISDPNQCYEAQHELGQTITHLNRRDKDV